MHVETGGAVSLIGLRYLQSQPLCLDAEYHEASELLHLVLVVVKWLEIGVKGFQEYELGFGCFDPDNRHTSKQLLCLNVGLIESGDCR